MPVLPTLEPVTPAGYVPLDEAARRAGVSVETMRRRIRSEQLPAVRLGRASNCPILVPAAALREAQS